MTFRTRVIATSAAGLLFPFCGAFGQAAGEGPASAAATDQDQAIEAVIVTAQRFEENVQKSSLDVQVIGGEELARAGITQARDIQALVPGLQIAAGANTPQTFIRGVGAFSSDANTQPAVAYNIDGVYIGDSTSVSALFYDVQRIEVLKGPQGTLYGRNASAGAINILTNRPSLDGLSGNVSVDVGNYDRVQTTGVLNTPLSSTVALRGVLNYIDRDGYLSDGTDDDQQRAGRLQLLFDDGERLNFLVTGDIDRRDGKGPGAVLLPRAAGNGKFVGAVDAENNALLNASYPAPIFFTPGSGFPPVAQTGLVNDSYVDNLQRNLMAEVNYDFGGVTATFVPSYRYSHNRIGTYIASIPFPEDLTTRQQSYEFRLSRQTDRLKAVAGAYYLKIEQRDRYGGYLSTILPNLYRTSLDNELSTEGMAGFAQTTYGLTDELRITLGGRYTHEEKTLDGSQTNYTGSLTNQTAYTPYDGSVTFSNFSFRSGLEYDLTPSNMLYLTISKGFKSGGLNSFAATPALSNAYDPETVLAYTVGARNRFAADTIQLNLEAFYWDITDSQQTHLVFDPTGTLTFSTFNAASATSYGAEVELMMKPTAADTLFANLAYLQAEFDQFVYSVPAVGYTPGSVGCPVAISGDSASIDCSGFPLARSPEWSGNAGYQHEFQVARGDSVIVGGDIDFATSRYTAVDYIARELAEDYVRVNAFLTVNFAGDVFSATAYVKNITNEEIPVGGIEANFAPGLVYSSVEAPRTYGVRLSARF